jgi:hypothetical protein
MYVRGKNPSYANRGRIPGRNWDQRLRSFPPCYAQSPLLTDLLPPPLNKSGLKLVYDVNLKGTQD